MHEFGSTSADQLGFSLEPAAAPKADSVSELTQRIKGVLEPAFQQVWVQGEISNYKPAASGHAYFSLKDAQSALSAAIFGWGAQRARGKYKFDLKDGLQVICRGRVTLYAPRGSYQLTIDSIEPLGAGVLQQRFEELKQRLALEGLFDSKRKRPIPLFPRTVAVVTSPTGAAIQDMLNILARRVPHVRVRVIPALVQGEGAARQVLQGLECVNRLKLADLIVLARGGGSIEDLWSFNDEALARAIVASAIPVISAVGHEIDFTIADFVADLRAPTPSAAAELLSGAWVESRGRLSENWTRLRQAMARMLQQHRLNLAHLSARVVSPRDKLRDSAQRCDELTLRMERAIAMQLERRRARLQLVSEKLDALSPLRVLERGYTIVHDPEEGGRVVRSTQEVPSGKRLEIRFKDGVREVQAT